jgi:hypothetical protein
MKHRNPIVVFLLPIITLGIYSWYWSVKTKGEMNKLGEKIPTAWIWLIPVIGYIWWLWEYSKGVEHVTNEKINSVLAFVVLFLLSTIGQAIIQDSFNKISSPVVASPVSPAPIANTPVANASPFGNTPPVDNTSAFGNTTPVDSTSEQVPPTQPPQPPLA